MKNVYFICGIIYICIIFITSVSQIGTVMEATVILWKTPFVVLLNLLTIFAFGYWGNEE